MVEPVERSTTVGGRSPASRAGQVGWALFDWANQPYFTAVLSFIYAPYFAAYVVGDPTRGQALWGYGQAVAGGVIAILGPVLGSIADAAGPRKPWILAMQAVCATGCALLWIAPPNEPGLVIPALAAVVAATIGAELSIVFNNAIFPSLTTEDRLGRLSGYAWSLGYAGGLTFLFLFLIGFTFPETPWLGLDKATHQHDRIVGPLSAVWLAIFIIPMFVFTPDTPSRGLSAIGAIRLGLRRAAATIRSFGATRNYWLFLIARMAYIDGLFAIFAFGGIYARHIFGWDTSTLGLFGIAITVAAMIGAFLGGKLDDRLGSKSTILIAAAIAGAATLALLSVAGADGAGGKATILFAIEVSGPAAGAAPFHSSAERFFLAFGMLVGLSGGPMQAASRTMVSRLSPPEALGAYYGLFAFSGKATAFLAPFLIAVTTDITNSQRAGVSCVVLFFAAGFALLLLVRERRSG